MQPNATSVDGFNFLATRETDEPRHLNTAGGASVWYSFTPTTAGRWKFATTYNPNLKVAAYYGSALTNLQPAADALGRVFIAANQTVYIAVEGAIVQNAPFMGRFTLQITPLPAPANDNFAGAQVLAPNTAPLLATSLSGRGVPGTTVDATKEAGEPKSFWAQQFDGLVFIHADAKRQLSLRFDQRFLSNHAQRPELSDDLHRVDSAQRGGLSRRQRR